MNRISTNQVFAPPIQHCRGLVEIGAVPGGWRGRRGGKDEAATTLVPVFCVYLSMVAG
jgi:hypothetical protein